MQGRGDSRLVLDVSSIGFGEYSVIFPDGGTTTVSGVKGLRETVIKYAGRAFQKGVRGVVEFSEDARQVLGGFAETLPYLFRTHQTYRPA